MSQLVSVDFFVVPTLTFRVLFVFVVLAHDRRQIVHVNVTGHPTAAWTSQQLRNAFPWDTAPRFLLHDRDGTYGDQFRACLDAMGIDEVLTAPRSPWQNPYVERLIGSMRRECVDHVMVLNERSLRRILRSYIDYYQHWRTHLALGKDPPVRRVVEPAAPEERREDASPPSIPRSAGLRSLRWLSFTGSRPRRSVTRTVRMRFLVGTPGLLRDRAAVPPRDHRRDPSAAVRRVDGADGPQFDGPGSMAACDAPAI